MIEIKDLHKSFDDNKVLKGINIKIEDGEIYGLIGRSGAGKSTILRCINGLEAYDSGSLTVNGIEVKSLKSKQIREFRKGIGMIFQHFSLLRRMTVYQNIALPMKWWGYKKTEIDRKVKELVRLVDIEEKLYSKTDELSGGQKQRVAIARALALNPRILLCDEATSALDPKTAKSILALLSKINQELGITIIIVTHQMSVLRTICEKAAIIEDGVVVANDYVDKLFLSQPKGLQNLIGQERVLTPVDGVTLKIMLSGVDVEKPILTQMARDIDFDFIVLGGEMEHYRDSVMGSMLINVPTQRLPEVVEYLRNQNVNWLILDREEG